ncbi:hypothetical protein BG452_13525 [Streptomyces sp. CBMA123]|nr:hypothetical protein [Streptomyces sp. CBMA123]
MVRPDGQPVRLIPYDSVRRVSAEPERSRSRLLCIEVSPENSDQVEVLAVRCGRNDALGFAEVVNRSLSGAEPHDATPHSATSSSELSTKGKVVFWCTVAVLAAAWLAQFLNLLSAHRLGAAVGTVIGVVLWVATLLMLVAADPFLGRAWRVWRHGVHFEARFAGIRTQHSRHYNSASHLSRSVTTTVYAYEFTDLYGRIRRHESSSTHGMTHTMLAVSGREDDVDSARGTYLGRWACSWCAFAAGWFAVLCIPSELFRRTRDGPGEPLDPEGLQLDARLQHEVLQAVLRGRLLRREVPLLDGQMWSAAVLAEALPGRSRPARASPVLSRNTAAGGSRSRVCRSVRRVPSRSGRWRRWPRCRGPGPVVDTRPRVGGDAVQKALSRS